MYVISQNKKVVVEADFIAVEGNSLYTSSNGIKIYLATYNSPVEAEEEMYSIIRKKDYLLGKQIIDLSSPIIEVVETPKPKNKEEIKSKK